MHKTSKGHLWLEWATVGRFLYQKNMKKNLKSSKNTTRTVCNNQTQDHLARRVSLRCQVRIASKLKWRHSCYSSYACLNLVSSGIPGYIFLPLQKSQGDALARRKIEVKIIIKIKISSYCKMFWSWKFPVRFYTWVVQTVKFIAKLLRAVQRYTIFKFKTIFLSCGKVLNLRKKYLEVERSHEAVNFQFWSTREYFKTGN